MIRPYRPKDKADLLALIDLLIPEYFAPDEGADYAEYLKKHREDYFVFVKDKKLIGAGGINYFLSDRLARISWDMVHPKHRGQGIGGQITQHRINLLKANLEIDKVVVRSSQFAYTFYQKQGFVLAKIELDYWSKGYDLYQLEMPLR